MLEWLGEDVYDSVLSLHILDFNFLVCNAIFVGILPIMWLPLSKKMAAMVGCWWQPTTIV
jgi:hypothetical protein